MFIRLVILMLCALAACFTCGSHAAPVEGESVMAHWEPLKVSMQYQGIVSSGYQCDALAARVAEILKVLGAHPATHVSYLGGCSSGVANNILLEVLTAVPAEAASSSQDAKRSEWLQELGITPPEPLFQAQRSTITLQRRLREKLSSGECELVDQISRELLPKLGIEVIESSPSCTARSVMGRPRLTVRALLAQATDDPPTPERKTRH